MDEAVLKLLQDLITVVEAQARMQTRLWIGLVAVALLTLWVAWIVGRLIKIIRMQNEVIIKQNNAVTRLVEMLSSTVEPRPTLPVD